MTMQIPSWIEVATSNKSWRVTNRYEEITMLVQVASISSSSEAIMSLTTQAAINCMKFKIIKAWVLPRLNKGRPPSRLQWCLSMKLLPWRSRRNICLRNHRQLIFKLNKLHNPILCPTIQTSKLAQPTPRQWEENNLLSIGATTLSPRSSRRATSHSQAKSIFLTILWSKTRYSNYWIRTLTVQWATTSRSSNSSQSSPLKK